MAFNIEYSPGEAARRAAAPKTQVKTRERVRELGEVFTHEREVNAMLDLVSDAFQKIDTRFLEPSAGSGNFLVEILARKLSLVRSSSARSQSAYEFAIVRALASIYAIDISDENVNDARDRMGHVIAEHFAKDANTWAPTRGFASAIDAVLSTNVLRGDTLNHAEAIVFVEYQAAPRHTFIRTLSPLVEPELDLFYVPPEPLPAVHYSKLHREPVR